MKYVFDTSPFVSLFRNFYPSTFVTLWQNFDALIDAGEIVSTREVYREIEGQEDDAKQLRTPHLTTAPRCFHRSFNSLTMLSWTTWQRIARNLGRTQKTTL